MVERGQTEKEVYLPAGRWVRAGTGEVFGPGRHTVHVPLHEFAAFVKEGAGVLECF